MSDWVGKYFPCFKNRYTRMAHSDSDDEDVFGDSSRVDTRDPLLWCRDIGKHCYGDYSFAIVQANEVIEDHSQVEVGRDATFVGIYDGHGGPQASRYTREHFFNYLIDGVKDNNGTMSGEIIRKAVSQTEKGFINFARAMMMLRELIVTTGTCCLVGIIWKGTLYIGNLGDSRAVLGVLQGRDEIVAVQLTRDDTANSPEVRDELKALHPDDKEIVVEKDGMWRVRGIIQVSKSIGDLYLKSPDFGVDQSYRKFYLPEPIVRPLLSIDPIISTRVLQPDDKFIIFASDGLWDHLNNQQAVEIVHKNQRDGIARRLAVTAQKNAAKKSKIIYDRLKRIDAENRRMFHDDITVVVIFLDNDFDNRMTNVQQFSIRGCTNSDVPSKFQTLEGNADPATKDLSHAPEERTPLINPSDIPSSSHSSSV